MNSLSLSLSLALYFHSDCGGKLRDDIAESSFAARRFFAALRWLRFFAFAFATGLAPGFAFGINASQA